jgi:hypothetical protein
MEIYYEARRNSVCCVKSVRGHFENSISFCGKRGGKSQLIRGTGTL